MAFWSKHFANPLVIVASALVLATLTLGLSGSGLPMPSSSVASEPGGVALRQPAASRGLTPGGEALPLAPTLEEKDGKPKANALDAAIKTPSGPSPVTKKASQSFAKTRPKLLTYTVQPGDTLSAIADRFGTDLDTLVGLNDTRQINHISVGQRLRVMTGKGALVKIKQGETLSQISTWYSVSVVKILTANGLTDPTRIQAGQEIIIPGVKPRRQADTVTSRGGLFFAWPIRGWITSRFGTRWGRQHEGVDLAASPGQPVAAAAPGRVVFSGWESGYGRLVVVDHGNGYQTRYGHNSRNLVSVGQHVERGQIIAKAGSTGNSTGTHVHFEVRVNGKAQNPLSWLRR